MKARLFALLSALSLLLCVAVVVLWVRSLGRTGSSYFIQPALHVQFTSSDGVLGLTLTRDSGLRPAVNSSDDLYGWFSYRTPMPPGHDRATLTTRGCNEWGFGFYLSETVGPPRGYWRFGGRRLWIVWVPFWLPVLLAALPPAWYSGATIRRRRRGRAGLCAACGYDLRATPDRCPECGARAAGFGNTGR